MSLKYDTHSPILINILKIENARNISPYSVIRIYLTLLKDSCNRLELWYKTAWVQVIALPQMGSGTMNKILTSV